MIFFLYFLESSYKMPPSETVCMILSMSYFLGKKEEMYCIMLSAEKFIQSDKH